MVERILLHVGDRKTATTSIQQTLAAGAFESAQDALLYPVPGGQTNHHRLVGALDGSAAAPGWRGRAKALGRRLELAKLARTLRRSRAEVAVISSEHFDRTDPEVLRAALARHMPDLMDRLHVLAYVRPHADRLLSSYTQSVKLGYIREGLAAFHARTFAQRRYLYAPRFARWRAAFGERYELVPMVRDHLAGGDVVTDFLHRVAGARPVAAKAARANASPAVADLALVRFFHTRLGRVHGVTSGPARSQMGLYLAEVLANAGTAGGRTGPGAAGGGAGPGKAGRRAGAGTAAGAGRERPALDRALLAEVAAAYGADAAALDAAFFAGTPMSGALARAPERAVAAPQSFRARDHFDTATLRAHRFWIDTVGAMMARDPEGRRTEATALLDEAARAA